MTVVEEKLLSAIPNVSDEVKHYVISNKILKMLKMFFSEKISRRFATKSRRIFVRRRCLRSNRRNFNKFFGRYRWKSCYAFMHRFGSAFVKFWVCNFPKRSNFEILSIFFSSKDEKSHKSGRRVLGGPVNMAENSANDQEDFNDSSSIWMVSQRGKVATVRF